MLAGCTGASSGSVDRLRVSAAVSLSGPLQAIAGDFEELTGTRVDLNFAGSDTLGTQLVAGAEADVFLSADNRQMVRVAAAGLLEAATRADLFSNQLVVVVPSDRPSIGEGVRALLAPDLRRIAIGDPDAVPAGVYAKYYLQAEGVWEGVREKVVSMRNVRAVLAAVEAGNVDAGIVYRTDLVLADRATVAFWVPMNDGPSIRYAGAVLRDTDRPELARRFLDFLREPSARQAFETAGFIVVSSVERHEP